MGRAYPLHTFPFCSIAISPSLSRTQHYTTAAAAATTQTLSLPPASQFLCIMSPTASTTTNQGLLHDGLREFRFQSRPGPNVSGQIRRELRGDRHVIAHKRPSTPNLARHQRCLPSAPPPHHAEPVGGTGRPGGRPSQRWKAGRGRERIGEPGQGEQHQETHRRGKPPSHCSLGRNRPGNFAFEGIFNFIIFAFKFFDFDSKGMVDLGTQIWSNQLLEHLMSDDV